MKDDSGKYKLVMVAWQILLDFIWKVLMNLEISNYMCVWVKLWINVRMSNISQKHLKKTTKKTKTA